MSHTETLDKSFEKLLEWHRRGVSRNTSSLDDEASELAHEAALDLYREEGAELGKELGVFVDAYRSLLELRLIYGAKGDAVEGSQLPEQQETLEQLVTWYKTGPPPGPTRSHYDDYLRTLRPGHRDPDDAREASDRDDKERAEHESQVYQYNQTGLGIRQMLSKPIIDAMGALLAACDAQTAKKKKVEADRAEEERLAHIARIPEIRALQQKRAMERYDAHSAKIAMLRQIGRKDPVV